MPITLNYMTLTPEGPMEVTDDFLAPGEEPRCDFCSTQPTAKRYECPDFITVGKLPSGREVEWVSIGHWMACDACMQLIEHGKLRALLRRSLRKIQDRIPPRLRDDHAVMVERHQRQFFERKLG